MKTLFVVPYPTEAPSNRLRVEQYFPYLEKHGVETVLRPFMSSDLYNIRHAPGSMARKVASLGFSTLSRFMDIRRAANADVVFVMGDGSIKKLSLNIELQTLTKLAMRQDGLPVGDF